MLCMNGMCVCMYLCSGCYECMSARFVVGCMYAVLRFTVSCVIYVRMSCIFVMCVCHVLIYVTCVLCVCILCVGECYDCT